MKRPVLVTGGAGYIGSHVCKALHAAGWSPVVYDSLENGHREAVRWGPLVQADLGDTEALRRAFDAYRPQAVMHFAAYAYVGESMTQPGRYFRNNTAYALNLLDAMVRAGVSDVVFSSTCATYGIPAQMPITEDTPQHPVNPYGDSKLFVERMLGWFEQAHGLRPMVLRYFNAAGADADGEIGELHEPETHLIPRAMLAAIGRLPHIDVFGTDYPTPDGTAVRDYIHVSDLASAHVRALEHLREGGLPATLNLGTGQGRSVREVIDAIEQVAGRSVPVRFAPRRPGDPPVLVADPSRALRVLGWEARQSDLETIVSTAWKWHALATGDAAARAAA